MTAPLPQRQEGAQSDCDAVPCIALAGPFGADRDDAEVIGSVVGVLLVGTHCGTGMAATYFDNVVVQEGDGRTGRGRVGVWGRDEGRK